MALKLSKKNGHPKVDIPSKLKNFYKSHPELKPQLLDAKKTYLKPKLYI
mgnify:CR=1 FL=1